MVNPIQIVIQARDEASAIFDSLKSKVAAVAAAIASYFGFQMFANAVKGAGDLEAALSIVKAVSGATAAEMILLRAAAEKAGATTQFSATEAATALGNLAKAGLNSREAIATLPAAINLAAAAGETLAFSSDVLTKVIMGMGLTFADAGKVADVLAAGANGANTDVKGLAEAMSYAAPMARSMGVSLEFTTAMMGQFANGGVDASRAGTALNSILSQFSDPASKFRAELSAAGITTGNFEQAMYQLGAAGKNGEQAIMAVGLEAGPALRGMLNLGIPALQKFKADLDSASGSAAATAKIMQENLNGSLKSLSSAWDTLKNALATPVLPILTAGVRDLSTAFTEAVANGTIGKFAEAISSAFQAAIKWVKAFITETDFTALAVRMQSFAAQTKEVFDKVGEYATNAGNIVKVAYGVMSGGINTVMAVAYAAGAGFATIVGGMQQGLALVFEGLSKISWGDISKAYKIAADEVMLSAKATGAAAQELGDKAKASLDAVQAGADMASTGMVALVSTTKTAADSVTGVGTAATGAAVASVDAGKVMEKALSDVGSAAVKSGATQQQAANDTRVAVEELRKEYAAAIAAGDAQGAVEKLQKIQTALKDTSKDAQNLAGKLEKEVGDALVVLGVTSQKELDKAAKSARNNFEIIKKSGIATAEEMAKSFVVVAEKAIAANGGIATSALKVEAAMHGVTITVDGTGKAIVTAMKTGAAAIKTVEDAYHALGEKTPAELQKIAETNEAVWEKIRGDSSATLEITKKAFTAYAQAAIDAAGDVGSAKRAETEWLMIEKGAVDGLAVSFDKMGKMTVQSQTEAANAINGTAGALGNQANAVDKVTAALERQNAEQEKLVAAQEKTVDLAKRQKALDDAKRGVDSEGWVLGSDGKRMSGVGIEYYNKLQAYETAKAKGISDAGAMEIGNTYGNDNIDYKDMRTLPFWKDQQAQNKKMESAITALLFTEKQAAITASKPVTPPASGTAQAAATAPVAHTYTVNIPSQNAQIGVSSDADAQALIRVLQNAKISAGA